MDNYVQNVEKFVKLYEESREIKLNFTEPYIVRIRQLGYKEFCKDLNKPFDSIYFRAMERATARLVKNKNIGGCKLGYTTLNEINLVFTGSNPKDYRVLKSSYTTSYISSWMSSMATSYFNEELFKIIEAEKLENEYREIKVDTTKYEKLLFIAEFKVNTFNLPKECIYDYLYMKCRNSVRNSFIATALSVIPDSERVGKSETQLSSILKDKGVDIEKQPWRFRYGTMCAKIKNPKSEVHIITLERPLQGNGTKLYPSSDKKNINKILFSNNLGTIKLRNVL